MGRRGPPPLPGAMKKARGTFRPHRESPSEPRGTAGVPDAPPGLDARERAEWDELGARLVAMGVLQKEQVEALEILVRTKVRYLRLAAKVKEMGEVLADAKGELYRNPHAIAMEKAEVEFRRMAMEFGITPAAATRVRADAEKGDDTSTARRFFKLVSGGARKGRSS